MFSLQTIKFTHKIAIIALVPLVGLLFLATVSIHQQYTNIKTAEKIIILADFSTYASALVHELQKERGMSAGYLGSQGKKFKHKIIQQRTLSDEKLTSLNTFLKRSDLTSVIHISNSLNEVMNKIRQRNEIRRGVTQLSLSNKKAISFYTQINAQFLNIISKLPQLSSDVDISAKLASYANFLKAKERSGIERAVLTNTFAQDKFGKNMFEKVITLIAEQNTYLDVFLAFSNDDFSLFYRKTMQGQSVNETNKMRAIALKQGIKGHFSVDADYWFSMQTAKINLLKQVEDFIAKDGKKSAEQLKKRAWRNLTINSLLVSVIVGISILLFIIVSKNIARQLGGEPTQVEGIAEIIAKGNLTHTQASEVQQAVGIFSAMLRMQQKLIHVVTTVSSTAQRISQSSNEVSNASQALSQSTSKQATSIEETSAAIEQLSATVEQNSENAKTTEKIALVAAESAIQGSKAVNQTVSAMEEIAKKITLIEEIAYQTNILSLNASIEAARAGKQGAGFSVVATEVRSLAVRSQETANDINQLADSSMIIAKNAGELLNEMLPNIQETASLIQEISVSSVEQAIGIQQITQSITQLTTVTQQNAAASEELAATANELSSESGSLVDEISFFKIDK